MERNYVILRPKSNMTSNNLPEKAADENKQWFCNAVFPLEADPTTLYYYKVGCKTRGVGDKNTQKRWEILGSASTPQQDVKLLAGTLVHAGSFLWGTLKFDVCSLACRPCLL